MTDESFFGRAATLVGVFAVTLMLMYFLGNCAADAALDRYQGQHCVDQGYEWHGGMYGTCRATPTPYK